MGQEMNCHIFSSSEERQQGGALLYILIAVVLLAALSFTLSNQTSQGSRVPLSEERVIFQVSELLQLSVAARASADSMLLAGSEINQLVFTAPNEPGFSVNSIHNIYHPSGGGLTYNKTFNPEACDMSGSDTNACGIFVVRHMNLYGTPTTAHDVVLYVHRLKAEVCQGINKRLTGSSNVPKTSVALKSIFIDGNNLTATNCAGCKDKSSLCLQGSNNLYGFYALLAPQ